MARPKKENLDYFPHFVTSGKTMFILETTYGNDGYAFWFKLLEILGSTSGLYIDCNKEADWEFLLAKTKVDQDKATEMLYMLSKLEAIDKELWNQEKIIWVQNLVDNVVDVFKKRSMKIPTKPGFTEQKLHLNGVSDSGNPQSKVKESKVNKSKVESNVSDAETLSLDNKALELCKYYEQLKPGGSISPQIPALKVLIDMYSFEWVKEALQVTISNKNEFIKSYMEKILKNWKAEGHTTTSEVKPKAPKIKRNPNNSFGNYSGQRQYDTEELRRQLLGRENPKKSEEEET